MTPASCDESTILRFCHLLEEHKLVAEILVVVNNLLGDKGLMLRSGTVVDAMLLAAPSSTKNTSGERDPEMHQTKKGNLWYFGMKAHIGADADSGLVHTVRATAANAGDVTEANSLLRGEESVAFGDAGYRGSGQAGQCEAGCRVAHRHATGQAQSARPERSAGRTHRVDRA